jgi:hypothetical protein
MTPRVGLVFRLPSPRGLGQARCLPNFRAGLVQGAKARIRSGDSLPNPSILRPPCIGVQNLPPTPAGLGAPTNNWQTRQAAPMLRPMIGIAVISLWTPAVAASGFHALLPKKGGRK